MNDKVFPEEVVRVTLSRGECLGECPVDWVEFKADGEARYEGYKFVRHEGSHRGTISKRRWNYLVKTILENRYFDLKNNYYEMVTDLPSEDMRVDTVGFFKEVNFYGFEKPRELKRIHSYINKLIDTIDWQPVSAGDPPESE